MAYPLEEQISMLLDQAKAQEADIASGLRDLQLPDEDVIQALLVSREEITRPAATIFEEYSKQQQELYIVKKSLLSRDEPLVWILITCLTITGIFSALVRTQILNEPYKTWLNNYYIYVWIIIVLFAIVSSVYTYVKKIRYRRFLEQKLDDLGKQVAKDLLETGIKPYLRFFINENQRASLETNLRIVNAGGLWSIMDATYEVPTAAKDKIERIINRLTGASIGIAGPRGAGKSTLLNGICYPERKFFNNQPVLTVLTSVPVHYNPKEFILHLFSQVCERLIILERKTYPRISRSSGQMARDRAISGFASMFLQYSGVFAFFFIMCLSGIGFSTYWVNQSKTYGVGYYQDYLNKLSKLIEPGEIFKVSLILLIISLFYFVQFFSHEFFVKFRRQTQTSFANAKTSREISLSLSLSLVKEAQKHLETIQYQMGFSAGWTGGVRLPDSFQFIESNADYSYSKTRNPLTLPEIVNDYRGFIQKISQKYKILIGIDELDKISSTETAQQFLNETKAIFGIPGCFYLVSVSDNALSNFERRGIAFRDEFDTSFDDVLFLETPDMDYGMKVLRRRVIGLPLPFVYFCYVLSGGLPRDLIRVCRDIFDIALSSQNQEEISLSYVASQCILSDLKSKIRAITIAATDKIPEPETSILLESIAQIKIDKIDGEKWREISQYLSSHIESKLTKKDSDCIERAGARKLTAELSAYLLFSYATLLFFKHMGQGPFIEQLNAEKLKQLEELARAKLLITVSPLFSRKIISEFCNNWHSLFISQ